MIAVVLVTLHCLTGLPVSLPVLPYKTLAATPIPQVNQTIRDQIGWPTYVAQISAAYKSVSATNAVILAANYAEFGAIDKYGPGLPRVYSGHNELYEYGPPPAQVTEVLAVGFTIDFLQRRFASCKQVGTLDNKLGIANEEQGRPLVICQNPLDSWAALWPGFRHLD
jgi:hypothetical protein